LAEGAFDAAERAVLGDSLLAGWCAKEAAAKALGQGLAGRPRAFVIEQDGAGFQVRSTGGLTFAVSLRQEGGAAMALALAAWQ
jgi:phosphopantetheinyl transferase